MHGLQWDYSFPRSPHGDPGVQENPCMLWKPKVCTALQELATGSYPKSVESSPQRTCSRSILSSGQNFVFISHAHHSFYIPRLSHPSLFRIALKHSVKGTDYEAPFVIFRFYF
jgi:hypothetical protein